jgi:hypothetical protein
MDGCLRDPGRKAGGIGSGKGALPGTAGTDQEQTGRLSSDRVAAVMVLDVSEYGMPAGIAHANELDIR